MTEQLSFDTRRARATGAWTTQAARKGGSLADLILQVLKVTGPKTDEEIVALFPDRNSGSVKTARSRLTGAGLVSATGECRKSQYGYWMQEWAATFRRTETVETGESL